MMLRVLVGSKARYAVVREVAKAALWGVKLSPRRVASAYGVDPSSAYRIFGEVVSLKAVEEIVNLLEDEAEDMGYERGSVEWLLYTRLPDTMYYVADASRLKAWPAAEDRPLVVVEERLWASLNPEIRSALKEGAEVAAVRSMRGRDYSFSWEEGLSTSGWLQGYADSLTYRSDPAPYLYDIAYHLHPPSPLLSPRDLREIYRRCGERGKKVLALLLSIHATAGLPVVAGFNYFWEARGSPRELWEAAWRACRASVFANGQLALLEAGEKP